MPDEVITQDLRGTGGGEAEFFVVSDCTSVLCTDAETGERFIGFILGEGNDEPLHIMFPIPMAEKLLKHLPGLLADAKGKDA